MEESIELKSKLHCVVVEKGSSGAINGSHLYLNLIQRVGDGALILIITTNAWRVHQSARFFYEKFILITERLV